jgi:hypothetical protein
MQFSWAGCDCAENRMQSFIVFSSIWGTSLFSVVMTFVLAGKIKPWLVVLVSVGLSVVVCKIGILNNMDIIISIVRPYFQ